MTYAKKYLIYLSQSETFVFLPCLLPHPSLLHMKIHMHTNQFINHGARLSWSSPRKLHLYQPKKPHMQIYLSDFLLNLCKRNQIFNYGTRITILLYLIPLVGC